MYRIIFMGILHILFWYFIEIDKSWRPRGKEKADQSWWRILIWLAAQNMAAIVIMVPAGSGTMLHIMMAVQDSGWLHAEIGSMNSDCSSDTLTSRSGLCRVECIYMLRWDDGPVGTILAEWGFIDEVEILCKCRVLFYSRTEHVLLSPVCFVSCRHSGKSKK